MKKALLLFLLIICTSFGEKQKSALKNTTSETFSIKVSLTSNQIKNLGSNPILNVVSPQTGKYIKIVGVDFFLDAGTIPFNSNNVYIGIGNTASLYRIQGQFMDEANDIFQSVDLQYGSLTNIIENVGLSIWSANDFTVNGNSTLEIYIDYKFITR